MAPSAVPVRQVGQDTSSQDQLGRAGVVPQAGLSQPGRWRCPMAPLTAPAPPLVEVGCETSAVNPF